MIIYSLFVVAVAVFALLTHLTKAAAIEKLHENFTPHDTSRQIDVPFVLSHLVCEHVNEVRGNFGMNKLHFSSALTIAAARHAHWMSVYGLLQHQDLQALVILSSRHHRLPVIGENLAKTWMTNSMESLATTVYNQWIHSTSHRANILASLATHCGTGFDFDSHGQVWTVQLFASNSFAPGDGIFRTTRPLRGVISGPFLPTLPSARPPLLLNPKFHENGSIIEDDYREKRYTIGKSRA